MRVTTAIFILMFNLSSPAHAFLGIFSPKSAKSKEVWSRYFPDTDCHKSDCGKDIPHLALEEMLEKASYLRPQALEKSKWMFLVDMTKHSATKRGFLINIRTGQSKSFYISHGIGSNGLKPGFATNFSNVEGSKMTSLGLYQTGAVYNGRFGRSMKLDGLESTNSNARKRYIVFHGYAGTDKSYIDKYGLAYPSEGCVTVERHLAKELIEKLKEGSLLYVYHQ
jgi:hypothetical protein